MKELFEKLLNDLIEQKLITEDKKSEYLEIFETKMREIKEKALEDASEIIDEDHTEKLRNLMEKVDENHTELLEKVLDHIDTKHTDMFKESVDKIDEDHTKKMQKVYDLMMDHKAEDLVEKVSDYLDTYLETIQPEEVIIKEEKLNRLEKSFEEMKKLVMINDDYIQDEVKEGIIDARNQMDEKDKEINRLMLEKVEMNKKLKKIESAQFLKDKVKDLSPRLRAYLETCFKDATQDYIEEKFDEAVKVFEEEESSNRELLSETVKSEVKPQVVVTEETEDETQENDGIMESYVGMINKSIKK